MKPSGAGSALCVNSLTVFSISPWETGLLKVSVSNEVNLGKLPFPRILSSPSRFLNLFVYTYK